MTFAREQQFRIVDIPWLSLRLGETKMIQVDVGGFYFLGAALQHLVSQLKEAHDISPRMNALLWAEYYVGQFLKSIFEFEEAKSIAEILMKEIHNAQAALAQPWSLFDLQVSKVENLVARFGDVLGHELKRMTIIYVPQEGIYRVEDLISNVEKALSQETRNKLSEEALSDFREGGRCLAFALHTAAGFHFLRSVERVLRSYYKLITGRDTGHSRRYLDWGTCIKDLRADPQADPKVIGVLDQIRELHRNPLMHPEIFLTQDEARGLFQISVSAIDAMGRLLA